MKLLTIFINDTTMTDDTILNDAGPSDASTDLIEFIASRLAHELVGPIGAISNGLELVKDLGAEAGEDVQNLVTGSAEAAGARLAFYRLAYGRAGFGITNIAQLRAAAIAFYGQLPRHDLSWPLPPVLPSLSEGVGRIVLLLCELAIDMAPRGGVITISLKDQEARVTARGDDVSPHEGIATILNANGTDIRADNAHAALAKRFSNGIGWRISLDQEDTSIVLTASRGDAPE